MDTKALFLTLVGGALLNGCATAVRGTNDTVQITSFPEGASVTSDIVRPDGGTFGCPSTPCELSLPRRAKGVVTVSLYGHDPISYRLVSSATTSNDVFVPGTVIAGLAPGSHVVVGMPRAGSQIGLRGASGLAGAATYGVGSFVDAASGATRNLVPQSVTIFLAPIVPIQDLESEGDDRQD